MAHSHFLHASPAGDRPGRYWWLVAFGWVTAFALGWYGFYQYELELAAGQAATVHSPIEAHESAAGAGGSQAEVHVSGQRRAQWLSAAAYHSLQMFLLHTPHLHGPVNLWIELGRWLAAVVVLAATGRALWLLFQTQLARIRAGSARGHVVICGSNRRGRTFARCCREEDPRRAPVVIDGTQATEAELAAVEATGARVLRGDLGDPEFLRRAGVHRAARLIAACDDDRTNIEIAVRASQLVRGSNSRRAAPLECFVQISDLELRQSFQRHEVLQHADEHVRVRFFDVYETVARRLFMETMPLDHGGIAASDSRQAHLVILGFGRMGQTIALRAAQLGHFANRRPLKISIVDRVAERHEQTMLFRYPRIRQVCDIEFHPLEVESAHAREKLEAWCVDTDRITSVVVCFDDDRLSLDVALRMLVVLRTHRVPLAVRMSSRNGLALLLQDGAAPPELRYYVRTFGDFDDAVCARAYRDATQDELAQLIQTRFVEKGVLQQRRPDRDAAMRAWEGLKEDYKDSNRQQADHIAIKVRAVDGELVPLSDVRPAAEFTAAEVELLAEMEHRRWIAERLLAGWVHAPGEKSEPRRTNPNLVPWSDLPESAKEYDRDAVRNIPHVVQLLGQKVCRRRPFQ